LVVEDVRCRPCCSSRCPLPRSVSTRCSLSGGRVSSPAVRCPAARCPTVGRPVTWFRRPDRPVRPSGAARPAASRLVSARPSCGVRPGSARRGPGSTPVRRGLHGWSGSDPVWPAACRAARRRLGGLDAGDAAAVVGRPVGEGAGREPGPVALGLRRRPRLAADRPGRSAWPEGGSSPAADLGQDAQLLSVAVVEPAAPSRRARKGQRARRRGWARGPSAAQPGSELAGSAPTTL
jgi:hypothetical protein